MAKQRGLKDKILELRSKGYSYNKIKEELNCSKATISYHLGINQKFKVYLRKRDHRKNTSKKKILGNILNGLFKYKGM